VAENSNSIKVLLVDDQALLRQSLALLLENQTGFNIVGSASDGHEAIERVASLRPDVVLIDIEMPNLDGLAATRLIAQRFPDTKVIVLSAYENEVYSRNALEAGAKAYLLKNAIFDELADTVRRVYYGPQAVEPEHLEKLTINSKARGDIEDHINDQVNAGISSVLFKDKSYSNIENKLPNSKLEDVLRSANVPLTLLDKFDAVELQKFVDYLLALPDLASTLQEDICYRLTHEPKNLSLLYLQGVLAHQVWQQPEIAFRSLEEGFNVGFQQGLPLANLMLFYRQAAIFKPDLAFRWLTRANGPWDDDKHLPFLASEARNLLGRDSLSARSLTLLIRIRSLKRVMEEQVMVHSPSLKVNNSTVSNG
jgi:DNA-binding NarL/FixJ family response regulator